jgi:hypothetical protein
LWLIHNQSVVIAYWLPAGVLCGWLAADLPYWLAQQLERLWRRWTQHELRWEPMLSWVLAAAMLILAGVGAWRRVNAVNPVTVLATAEDVQAIQWAAEHLPEDALVLINSARWQGELRSGTDGGWWLPILARRQVTLPCVLYAQGSPDYFVAVSDLARTVEEAPSVDDPELLSALEEAGVTHVFVGARGGKLMPQELDASPHFRSLYVLGPVRVYAFESPGAADTAARKLDSFCSRRHGGRCRTRAMGWRRGVAATQVDDRGGQCCSSRGICCWGHRGGRGRESWQDAQPAARAA